MRTLRSPLPYSYRRDHTDGRQYLRTRPSEITQQARLRTSIGFRTTDVMMRSALGPDPLIFQSSCVLSRKYANAQPDTPVNAVVLCGAALSQRQSAQHEL